MVPRSLAAPSGQWTWNKRQAPESPELVTGAVEGLLV